MKEFNAEELKRYSRHFVLDEFGLRGQMALKSARVLIVGAGGLGCPALLYLTAAGAGTLGIADHDTIDLSNLQRQVLFTTEDIGARRLHTLLEKLLEEISFLGSELENKNQTLDSEYVKNKLEELVKDQNLRQYVL